MKLDQLSIATGAAAGLTLALCSLFARVDWAHVGEQPIEHSIRVTDCSLSQLQEIEKRDAILCRDAWGKECRAQLILQVCPLRPSHD